VKRNIFRNALPWGILLTLFFGLAASQAKANDHIFPPSPAASRYISFDRHGFLINGKRTFIVSAGMEYARVPRDLWRDRLLRLKRAGFNCVEMYNFWNWHEPEEGKFDFTGSHDLNAYLKLVKKMGMYAICRVGPYYCAEWTNGGYPIWLRSKPGLVARVNNPVFLKYVDRYFDKLIPIVAKNQINHGGPVILVQLENEHPGGWGTEDHTNGYLAHLRKKALSLGLQVPYFYSGLHHGSDPAGNGMLDDPTRPNPWMTTEFWSVWYSDYGPHPGDAGTYSRRTWKIIAHGGNGYNYYMAHGGSNFGYTNNNEDAASYDYGAAVGQGGDLRPMYYAFKRAAWFARSFEDILENSDDATADYQGVASNPEVRVTARKSPAGTIVFLDNRSNSSAETTVRAPQNTALSTSSELTLEPEEIIPVVEGYKITPNVTISWAPTRVLGIFPQGDTITMVVYGQPGSPAEVLFKASSRARILQGARNMKHMKGDFILLNTRFSDGNPEEYVFSDGKRRIRVLAMSQSLAERTWLVHAGEQPFIICGPDYVGDASLANGKLKLNAELPWVQTKVPAALAFSASDTPIRLRSEHISFNHPKQLTLSGWEVRSAMQAAAPHYKDQTWLKSVKPLQMGSDGDLTADAWYRTRIDVPKAGDYSFHAQAGGDRMIAYVDGKRVGAGNLHEGNITLRLPAGRHTLAIFTAHDGRSKICCSPGPIYNYDPKGLMGTVTLQNGNRIELKDWRMMPANGRDDMRNGPPSPDDPRWTSYTVGEDAFHRQPGYAWFQTTFTPAVTKNQMLIFESVDDNGTVFVNGKEIAHHDGWNEPFEVSLNGVLKANEPAVISVFVHNTANVGGIASPVYFTNYAGDGVSFGEWRMKGGPGDPNSNIGWSKLTKAETFDGPTFFRTSFNTNPPAEIGTHPIWRVVITSMGHGSVWVNGRNLGRYPEKIPINGLYIPECWLKPGRNKLVIYDEDGTRPDKVTVSSELAASRDVYQLIGDTR
jgi:beta-galactosidase